MVATASQFNSEVIPIDYDQSNVRELMELVNQDSSRFRRIALARLGNVADAEDAFQDALLAALTNVDQFRGEAKMSTWLTSIVITTARMKLRKRSALVHLALEETDRQYDFEWQGRSRVPRPGPETEYRKRETAEIVAPATSYLSPVLRRTFELRDVNGLSIRETAHLMGVPSGTIKARLARARMKHKEMIAKSARENVC